METSHMEDVDAVRQALTKLMAIADRLETRNAQTVQRIEAATVALDLARQRLQVALAPRHGDDGVVARQALGDRPADAARRTGDDGRPGGRAEG